VHFRARNNCQGLALAQALSEEISCAWILRLFQTMTTTITSYRDLDAWHLGMSLVEDVYALTQLFPRAELFGLTSQLRRASISIPSQIAEGHQQGTKAYRHYVIRGLGSLAEVETQLELAQRLKLAPQNRIEPVRALASRVGQVLHGLVRSLLQT
jgi:four helix bundle protein